jgi:outer membrane protein assembly factor BamD (BamD/ComL family)
MKSRTIFLAVAMATIIGAGLASCAGAPKSIPDTLSAQELIQRAQEASDKDNYAAATAYYQALLDRYGTDASSVCIGEYELSFIAYKQGRYEEAQKGFEKLLDRYSAPGGNDLPQAYKILAQKVLVHVKELIAAKH